MAKKQQRFTQKPTVFEPTEAEIDAVLADVFTEMDKAEADRLAREQHALEMLADYAEKAIPCPACDFLLEDDGICAVCGYDADEIYEDDEDYDKEEWDEEQWNDYYCPCCGAPRHSCDCDGSGCEKSERAEVVEEAIREDELDDLRKLESSLLAMLDELRDKIREQVERQNANDDAHCDGRAEMETLATWLTDENPGSSSWWLDTPIPFALTPKALNALRATP